jgi:nucleoside-diphosphate-sugar epimerase
LNFPPKRFTFASTSETYAAGVTLGITKIPSDEKVPLIIDDIENPRWSYACSKINGESAVISASIQNNLKFTIVRYHNIYGPRMGVNHIIPDYINRAKLRKYELYGGNNKRSFLYIEDAIDDTIKISKSDLSINEIINIGSSDEYSMIEVAENINKILNIESKIKVFESPDGSVLKRVPDLSKINKILGIRERITFLDGLKKTIEYYGI